MECPKCGAVVPNGTNFCPACGHKLASQSGPNKQTWGTQTPQQPAGQADPWQQSGSGRQPGWQDPQPGNGGYNRPVTPDMPMKWFKFEIYFLLWLGGMINILGSFPYILSGNVISMLYGAVCLGAGAFQIYTRYRLAQFRADGPRCLYISYVIPVAASLLYAFLGDPSLLASSVGSAVSAALMIWLNSIYFGKRAHLFRG